MNHADGGHEIDVTVNWCELDYGMVKVLYHGLIELAYSPQASLERKTEFLDKAGILATYFIGVDEDWGQSYSEKAEAKANVKEVFAWYAKNFGTFWD